MNKEKKLEITNEERIQDMTSGSPGKLIFKFMLPVVGGNFLQQLYTVVDAAIVGQGVGVDALAAVGATDWVYWFLLWAAAGFGQGFSVIIAAAFGEKNSHKLKVSVNMSIVMSIAVGAVLSAVGIGFSKPVLKLLNTPENIFDYAHTYLAIMYIGIFVIAIYNTLASILRALGDSRNPFIGLLISTVMNIVLDLIFVMLLRWGVAGAAVASVLSQTAAGIYCLIMLHRVSVIRSERKDWRMDKKMLLDLWNKGLATSFQYAVIAVGGIVVQFGLNSMGFLYVAGFTATNKLYGVLEAISLAMGSAMMIYTSQNYGAGNKKRIQEGVRVSILFGIIISAVLGIAMIGFGKQLLMLFIDQSSPAAGQVLKIAYRYLFIMSSMLIVLYVVNTYRYIIMALDKMPIVVLASSMELAGRIVMTILILKVFGAQGIYFIEVTAWMCAAIVLFIAYYVIIKKLQIG